MEWVDRGYRSKFHRAERCGERGLHREYYLALDNALIDILNERLGYLRWGIEEVRGRVRQVRHVLDMREEHYFLDGDLVLVGVRVIEGGGVGWKLEKV